MDKMLNDQLIETLKANSFFEVDSIESLKIYKKDENDYILTLYIDDSDKSIEIEMIDLNKEILTSDSYWQHSDGFDEYDRDPEEITKEIDDNYNLLLKTYPKQVTIGNITIKRYIGFTDCYLQIPHSHSFMTASIRIENIHPIHLYFILTSIKSIIAILSETITE